MLRLLTRQKTPFLAAAVVAVFGVLFAVRPVYALLDLRASIFEFLSNIVMGVISTFGNLIAYLIKILVGIMQYNNFVQAPIVQQGEGIVRDVANMFFIVALIIIAVGTVLRLRSYRYNQLLGQLIIMAFLTNFALLIAGFFIQTAQVVMITFVNAFKDIAVGNFAYMFGLDAVLKFATPSDGSGDAWFAIFVTLLAGLAMMVVALVVTAAVTVLIFVRIIALWILLILSPMAYALRILPNTEGYARQWWSEFGRYVTVGPVVAFFLWLALFIAAGGSNQGQGTSTAVSFDPGLTARINETEINKETTLQFKAEIFTLDRFLTFLVSIIFLIMALHFSVQGAGVAKSWVDRVAKVGFAGAATVTGLNWIRDRTVAPIQGYLQTRAQRGKKEVAERAAAIDARAGRGLAATVGQVGRVRAAAGAGLGTAVKQAGKLVTGRTTFREAARQVGESAAYGAEFGTRGRRQAMQRFGEFQARRLGETAGEYDLEREDGEKLRQIRAATNNDLLKRSIGMALGRRGLLRDDEADRNISDETYSSLTNVPQLRKEFEDSLRKNNPALAIATIYRDFRADLGAADAEITRFAEEIARGLISPTALTAEVHGRIKDLLQQVNPGMSDLTAKEELGQRLVRNVQTQEDIEKLIKPLTRSAKEATFGGIRLGDEVKKEKRYGLANVGLVKEAVTHLLADGTFGVKKEDLKDWLQNYAMKAKDIVKTDLLSIGSQTDRDVIRELRLKDEIDNDDWVDGTKNTDVANRIAETARQLTEEINAQTGLAGTADSKEKQGRENNKLRELVALVKRGGDIEVGGVKHNPLEYAYYTNRPGASDEERAFADEAVRRAIKSQGKNYTRMEFDEAHPTTEFKNFVTLNLAVRDYATIDDKSPGLVDKMIKHLIALFERGSDEQKRMSKNILQRIRRNDKLASYVSGLNLGAET